jgi:hypothetical protein
MSANIGKEREPKKSEVGSQKTEVGRKRSEEN